MAKDAKTQADDNKSIADGLEHNLTPEIYAELRTIAHAQLRGQRTDATLSTTALVHEAYLRIGERRTLWNDQHHFYATMAKIMRQVAVDLARRKSALKRDGGIRVDLDDLDRGQIEWSEISDLIAIDIALEKLGALEPRLEQVMEMRFFAGMAVTEVAAVLGLSEPTVKRDTRTARAFLGSELTKI